MKSRKYIQLHYALVARTLIAIPKKSTLKSIFSCSSWDIDLKLCSYVLGTKTKFLLSRFLILASEMKMSNFKIPKYALLVNFSLQETFKKIDSSLPRWVCHVCTSTRDNVGLIIYRNLHVQLGQRHGCELTLSKFTHTINLVCELTGFDVDLFIIGILFSCN